MELVSGDDQSGTVGTELASPVVARVVDDAGRPVKGQLVNFRIASGGGSAFAGSSITDAEGKVRERWTLGTHAADAQRLEARAVDNGTGAAIVFATFKATALPGAASGVQVVMAPATAARSGVALSPQPSVRLVDQYANPVRQAGASVVAAVAPGDANHTLGGTTTRATDAEGVASFTDLSVVGTAGSVTLSFSAQGITGNATIALQLGAGGPAAIVVAGGDNQAAAVGTPVAESPRVRVTDGAGNPVSGELVTFTVTAGGGRVGVGSVATDANGYAFTSWTLGTTAGANSLQASLGAFTVTFSATGTAPGSPALALVNQPSADVRVDQTFASAPVVQLRDEFGNALAISGVQVSAAASASRVTLVLGAGTFVPATVSTDAAGRATFTGLAARGPAGQFTITFTATGYSPVTSTSIALAPGDPKSIAAISPATQQVGAAEVVTLTVAAVDAGGNRLSGVPVSWSLQGGSGSLSATSTTTDASGVTSVQYTAPSNVGAQIYVKASGPVGWTELGMTVVKGPPRNVIKLAGDNQRASAGTAVETRPSVRVTDAGGNGLQFVTVNFTAGSGGGTVTGATQTTDANGVATVGGWTLGPTAGATNTLVASVGSLSATFTAVAQSPTISLTISQPAAGAYVGDAVPVTATAYAFSGGPALTSVVASVGDRSVSLTQSATSTTTWSGTLSLAGVSVGVKELLVTATNTSGETTTRSVSVKHDAPPTLAATELPRDGTVARGAVRIRASCQDDGPSCTIAIRPFDRSAGYGAVLAQAQGTLDQTVSLSSLDGTRVRLRIVVTDTAGQSVFEERLVYVESSTKLAAVDSVGGTILDVDADRILHGDRYTDSRDSTVTPAIWNRAARADATLTGATTAGGGSDYARLTRVGAIFMSNGGGPTNLLEWRGGALTNLGIASSSSLAVSGDFAVWSNSTTLRRRDLAAGTTVVVSTTAGNTNNDVAANGDVAFWQSGGVGFDVLRYRDGATTRMSTSVGTHTAPLTDGTRVVWRAGSQIAMNDGAGEVMLTTTRTSQPSPRMEYAVNNGWLAYVKPGASSASEVWLRSPDGTERLVSAGLPASIASLGPAGEIVISSGSHLYLVPTGGQPTPIGTTLGRPIWVNGRLNVAIGGTLFEVTP